jgi:hypothetical protein
MGKINVAYGFWRAVRMRATRVSGDFSRMSAAFFASVRALATLITAWEEFSTACATERRAGADLVKIARIGWTDSLPIRRPHPNAAHNFSCADALRCLRGGARFEKTRNDRAVPARLAGYDTSHFG